LPDESVLISVGQMWKVHSLFKGEYLFAALNATSDHQMIERTRPMKTKPLSMW